MRADRPGRDRYAGDDFAPHGRAGRLGRLASCSRARLLTQILLRAMTDQDGSGPTLVHLTAEQARDTVAGAAQQYFESRRGPVERARCADVETRQHRINLRSLLQGIA